MASRCPSCSLPCRLRHDGHCYGTRGDWESCLESECSLRGEKIGPYPLSTEEAERLLHIILHGK